MLLPVLQRTSLELITLKLLLCERPALLGGRATRCLTPAVIYPPAHAQKLPELQTQQSMVAQNTLAASESARTSGAGPARDP